MREHLVKEYMSAERLASFRASRAPCVLGCVPVDGEEEDAECGVYRVLPLASLRQQTEVFGVRCPFLIRPDLSVSGVCCFVSRFMAVSFHWCSFCSVFCQPALDMVLVVACCLDGNTIDWYAFKFLPN